MTMVVVVLSDPYIHRVSRGVFWTKIWKVFGNCLGDVMY